MIRRLDVRALLPPNAAWAGIEALLVLLGTTYLVFCLRIPAPAGAFAAGDGREPPRHEIPLEERARLTARFPASPAAPEQQRELLERVTRQIETLGLVLESHGLEPSNLDAFPARHVYRFQVSGPAPAHARLIAFLDTSTDPVRIRNLTWSAGRAPAPAGPLLDLTLELLAPSPPP